ncbi:hypothetical protein D9M68_626030 [compost metagenome]
MRRRTFHAAPSSSTKAVSTPASAALLSAATRTCEVLVSSVSCQSVPGRAACWASIGGPRRRRTSSSLLPPLPLASLRTETSGSCGSGARLYCRLRDSRWRASSDSGRSAASFHDGSEARITTPFSSLSSIWLSAPCQRFSSGSSPILTTATPTGLSRSPSGADR